MHRFLVILVATACAIVGACEKPTAKFHPGDRVFVKENPRIRGVVTMRLSPLNEDLYYIAIRTGSVPSGPYLTDGDDFALIPPTRHYDGGYLESELELDHQ
jgi:hypothetical protein